MNFKIISLLSGVLIAGGCADSALFVTKTSLGIDVETKPPQISLVYDRTEGFYGPRYENGAVPPVVASIRTDGKVLNPHVRQVYATGDAAKILTDPTKNAEDLPLQADRAKPMFFGTSTTLGFKVSFSTINALPDSAVFGFKRKEASFIPLGVENGEHKYASVLAAIDTESNFDTFTNTGNGTAQFFASGYAAENLAREPSIRELMIKRAAESVADDSKELNAALATIAAEDTKADVITKCLTHKDGTLDQASLESLLGEAPSISLAARNDIARSATGEQLGKTLKEDYDTSIDSLFQSLNKIECAKN